MKKTLIAASVAAAIGTAGIVGVSAVNAATTTTATNPMTSLVDAVASKFNLNKTDVQAVFDEQKTKMQAEREAQIKEDVAQLVTDGKITQAQADKMNAKRAEILKEREANKDSGSTKTRDEMKAEMETRKTEIEQWAKDNGISSDYLRYVMGGGRGHGGHGFGDHKLSDPAVSDQAD